VREFGRGVLEFRRPPDPPGVIFSRDRKEVNMAKNTGHGYRRGSVTGRTQVKTASGYVKRDSTSGRFMDVKSDGKPFKGVTTEK
jgi:hypothetical protein